MKSLTLRSFSPWVMVCLLFVAAPATLSQQTDPTTKQLAEQYVDKNDPRFRETQDLMNRFRFLTGLAPAAYSAGRNDQAKQYAEELLLTVKAAERENRHVPNIIGVAIHVSNSVLGLISIDDGKTVEAANYLLASGRVFGNPPDPIHFGPDMLLAKRLLEKGDRATVIQYFDLCANFWKHAAYLEPWKKAVQQGEIPNFGIFAHTLDEYWRFDK